MQVTSLAVALMALQPAGWDLSCPGRSTSSGCRNARRSCRPSGPIPYVLACLHRPDGLHMPPIHTTADATAAVVLSAQSTDVETVLVAGQTVKHNGTLLGHDIADLREQADSARRRIIA